MKFDRINKNKRAQIDDNKKSNELKSMKGRKLTNGQCSIMVNDVGRCFRCSTKVNKSYLIHDYKRLEMKDIKNSLSIDYFQNDI